MPSKDDDKPMDLPKQGLGQQLSFDLIEEVDANGKVTVGSIVLHETEFRQDPCYSRESTITASTEKVIADGKSEYTAPLSGEIVPKTGYGVLKNVDITKCDSLSDFLKQVTVSIPVNESGLPLGIYRPDMLDFQYIKEKLAQGSTTTTSFSPHSMRGSGIDEINAYLESAFVRIVYDNGYPAFVTGLPLWKQLEFEPNATYQIFMEYIALPGIRRIDSLIAYPEHELLEYSGLYYWPLRAKAFDVFRLAHHQKIKLQRMLDVEDTHYAQATKIMSGVMKYLSAVDWDDLDEVGITPDKAVAMMEKLVKIQRISVGLPANGESKESLQVRPDMTTEELMQRISQADRMQVEEQDDELDLLTDNPESIALAQELLIQMQKDHK